MSALPVPEVCLSPQRPRPHQCWTVGVLRAPPGPCCPARAGLCRWGVPRAEQGRGTRGDLTSAFREPGSDEEAPRPARGRRGDRATPVILREDVLQTVVHRAGGKAPEPTPPSWSNCERRPPPLGLGEQTEGGLLAFRNLGKQTPHNVATQRLGGPARPVLLGFEGTLRLIRQTGILCDE